MDVDHPEGDQGWDHDTRGETQTERLDRNWNSLLQELRVVQTGVQLLTGVTVIIFVAVAGTTAGLIAGGLALTLFAFFWWLLPLSLRTHGT
ncbi:DUF6328 family protein [Mycobacterium montefiorense]|uniref:DUF6328 family protein n=1 Tax=Mycobacterium montefiorense TaxID=154654 RepID=UPI0021F2EAA5|nr:DUF6328 family protein [Mycobacterium montefiorense]MCV7426897.1 hypothetical protein [Mycobacterium montefiorense]